MNCAKEVSGLTLPSFTNWWNVSEMLPRYHWTGGLNIMYPLSLGGGRSALLALHEIMTTVRSMKERG